MCGVSRWLQYISSVAHYQLQCWRPHSQTGGRLGLCWPRVAPSWGPSGPTSVLRPLRTEEVTQDLWHRPRPLGTTQRDHHHQHSSGQTQRWQSTGMGWLPAHNFTALMTLCCIITKTLPPRNCQDSAISSPPERRRRYVRVGGVVWRQNTIISLCRSSCSDCRSRCPASPRSGAPSRLWRRNRWGPTTVCQPGPGCSRALSTPRGEFSDNTEEQLYTLVCSGWLIFLSLFSTRDLISIYKHWAPGGWLFLNISDQREFIILNIFSWMILKPLFGFS